MPKAIRMHQTGGPEVLMWEDYDPGKPAANEVRLRHTAIGLNFIDAYIRTGLYPNPGFPCIPGMEAAGVVEELGSEVVDLRVGDRVAYPSSLGAYTEIRTIPADKVVKIPAGISDQTAAAAMLKGMTAQYLLRKTFPVRGGETILVHAAAGGVGLILCQWLSHLGATVIGTVGSDEKAKLAKANGCKHTIVYTRENFTARVREITAGKGVPVVYDSVGKDTFEGSLDCLSPRGLMVSFGNGSGPVPPFTIAQLGQKGSLFLTRPVLFHHIATHKDLLATAADLIHVISSGAVKISVHQTYALKDAAQAHRDLEARKTTGSTVLVV